MFMETLEFWKCETEFVIDYQLLDFVVYEMEFAVESVALDIGNYGLEFVMALELSELYNFWTKFVLDWETFEIDSKAFEFVNWVCDFVFGIVVVLIRRVCENVIYIFEDVRVLKLCHRIRNWL